MDSKTSLAIANNLESVKRYKLRDTPAAIGLAKLIQNGFSELPYLNQLTESFLVTNKGKAEADKSLQLTPENIMYRDLLGEDLRPWAEALRLKLFKQKNAPFPDYNSATDWVKQFDVPSHSWKENPEFIESEKFRRNIAFWNSEGDQETVCARMNSTLEKLIFSSQKLADRLEIGLDWNSLVFYILTDIAPYVSPIEIGISTRYVTLPSRRTIKYREAEVKIREGFNLTYLQWLYEVLREDLQLSRKKPLNINHLQLYRLIKQKGKVPTGKGTVKYWENIMRDWNSSHPKSQYNTWKGVRIAYERLLEKLNADTKSALAPIEYGPCGPFNLQEARKEWPLGGFPPEDNQKED
jgi:hypothetical protein